MKFQTYLITLLLFAAACGETAQKPAAEPGSTAVMYHNGDIITMEGNQPQYAESVVVKDGKILFVGSKAEAMTAAGPGHQMVDLQGKTMLPAFIDGHGHYISSLTVANQVNVYAPPAGPGTDPDAIVAEIKKFIEKNKVPKGELVQCYGYDENVMPKDNQLNTGHLDAAFKDHPVLVGLVSMHGAVLNSVALKNTATRPTTKRHPAAWWCASPAPTTPGVSSWKPPTCRYTPLCPNPPPNRKSRGPKPVR